MYLSAVIEMTTKDQVGTTNGDVHHMGVSKNKGTPKSSILIGFSIINHPFWGTIIFGNTHIVSCFNTDHEKVVQRTC